jgi:plastocyanin
MSRRGIRFGGIAGLLAALACAVPAHAADPPVPEAGGFTPLGADVQRLHFKYGPIHVEAGANLMLLGPVTIEKPQYDGYITRIRPDLVEADGSVPAIEKIHLHHAVWLSTGAQDATCSNISGSGGAERFFASGEEKTVFRMPAPYGYPVRWNDMWLMDYMVHNETPIPQNVWITYDVDFVPANSALGRQMKPVRPIWMDVQNCSAYPVFDTYRGSGTAGKIAYPDDFPNAYGGKAKNEWTVDRDGTLVTGAGHVHPGGLWDDLFVQRQQAPARAAPQRAAAHPQRVVGKRRATAKRRHRAKAKRVRARKAAAPPGWAEALAFRSEAKYFDPGGPISWDLAMTATPPDWRIQLHKGDKLRLSTTYETDIASWYESMGIFIAYMADGDTTGKDPFVDSIQTTGRPTHGHLAEAGNHGGEPGGAPDPRTLPDGQTLFDSALITGFEYLPGNQGLFGFDSPPVVPNGGSITFNNVDAAAQIFHTLTACKAPCTGATGVSYPLADGPVNFDSGELGYGPSGFTAAANRTNWATPKNLTPGTYTYFCRIHPFMRGAFRVK